MIIVDASLAIKWTVEEVGRQSALQLLAGGEILAVPDLFWLEVANVLRTKIKIGEISPLQARTALTFVEEAVAVTLPTQQIVEQALSLALRLDHAVYDCIYLACALSEEIGLVTADQKFVAKCRIMGAADLVQSADDWLMEPFAPTPQALSRIRRALHDASPG